VTVLQDQRTHLFHHRYDDAEGTANGVFWGRGNGWALLGLVSTLEELPPDHHARPAVVLSLRRLSGALVAAQDTAGLWHTVIDHPDTYLEASASLMIGGGLMRAARAGWVPASYGDAGLRAWQALWDDIDDHGTVRNVSARTPSRSTAEAYQQRPVGGAYPWGQGAYLLGAAAALGSRPA